MNYNINSFAYQCNRFANFVTNPYFNPNVIPNSAINPNVNQCIQCPDRPFVRTLITPNVFNTCHIQSSYHPRRLIATIPTIPITSSLTTRHSSTFTIDSILDTNNKINSKDTNCINSDNSSIQSSQSNNQTIGVITDVDKNLINETNDDNEKNIYKWLSCTRFKPPKVKKRLDNQPKRKAINRGPRIPFTSCQIRELENKFCETHYLSSLEVMHLANKLNLTDSRIRIWFQNRRARDKREKRLDPSEDLIDSSRSAEPVPEREPSNPMPDSYDTQ